MGWMRGCISLGICTVVGTAACSSDNLPQSQGNQRIEVWSTWSASDGQGLDAAISVYQQQYPGATVMKSALSVMDTAAELRSRFESGAPPTVFQTTGGSQLCVWVTQNQSYIEDLDAFAAARGWTDPTVLPTALQDMIRCVGPDGAKHFYGIPVVIHRWNTLFYNKAIFAQLGIAAPPASIEEFFSIAEKIKREMPDVAPLAVGTTPMEGGAWPLATVVMASLLSGMQGTDWYRKFYTGQADLSNPTTEDWLKLNQVLEAAARMLDYVNPNFQDLGWAGAAELVHSGKAAMTVLGDWVNGNYISAGWSATDGFGGRAAFGDAFLMGIDTLGVASGAQNRAGGMNFLTTMASVAGMDAFDRVKGGIPPRVGALDATYNDYARATYNDFWTAGDRLVPSVTYFASELWMNAVWGQFNEFQLDKNVDQLMLVIRNNYDQMKQ